MVSLVLIGHSSALLHALRAMVAQAAPAVTVALAGGTAGGGLGTSSPEIGAALRAGLAASGGDGVVAIFDLGSAAMALEMALEELAPADRARVAVSQGPIVEGAVRAAVEAASGADRERVRAVADAERLAAKLPPDWLAGAGA